MKNKNILMQIRYCAVFALVTVLFAGCSFVSYYDSVSYKNLTDLKGEMKVVFDDCMSNTIAGEKGLELLKSFQTKSSQAYEYENGKGNNDDTVAQLAIIRDTVGELLPRYEKNVSGGPKQCKARSEDSVVDASTGCLTSGYCKAKWKILEFAFDIAISTENLKIKSK